MNRDRVLVKLIDGFHRSVVEPAVWGQSLDLLLDVFHSQHAFLFTTDDAEAVAPLLVTAGIEGEDRDRFLSEEAERAWAPVNANIVPGRASGIEDVIRITDFEASDFYNSIVRPTNCFYSGFIQGREPNVAFHLALCRPRGQGTFEAGETDLLQELLPHLTTALDIRRRLHVSEHTVAGFEELFRKAEHAAMMVDADCKPSFVNARASELLSSRDGLSVAGGQLHTAVPSLTSQLHGRVAHAANSSHSSITQLYVPRAAPRLPLVLELLPIWRLDLSAAGVKAPRVAITIKEPSRSFKADKRALQQVLKLTPRESEIAALLASGATIEGIATQLGLTSGTVRYNLQRVFDKAGVHTQGALVALVHSFGSEPIP